MRTPGRVVIAIVALLLGAAAAARAEPPGEVPARAAPHRKSLATAYLVTIAATSAPLMISALGAGEPDDTGTGDTRAAVFGMVGIAGMVLGPSAGHWYAGEGVTTGLLLRGGAAVATGALVLGDPHLERPAPTLLGLLGAVGVWEVGVIWDAWTLPRAIRRHNRALEVQVAPLVTTHGVTPGVTLAGRF